MAGRKVKNMVESGKIIHGLASTGDVWIGNKQIDLSRSLAVICKSPSGFAWGYHGSGPAQLALAILLEVCDNEQTALRLFQDFKRDIIAGFDTDQDLLLPVSAVTDWLKKQREGGAEHG